MSIERALLLADVGRRELAHGLRISERTFCREIAALGVDDQ
jgi:hypothetical protein